MDQKYYNMETNEVIFKLKTNSSGLNSKEVKNRLSKYGLNKLKETNKKGIISKFIDQFKNIMLIILIISAILSAIVSVKTGEPFTDTIIILFVVILNALLGVIQESKAEKAIDALKNMSLPYIKVKRDGSVQNVKTEEIVIGDIALIEAGDYIPADMRIISNHSLRVEEAALTGESASVDKNDKVISNVKDVPLGDRLNMLYSGSSVVYGRGEAVVVAIGMDTELGKIAKAISHQDSESTPLQRKMDELSKVLSIIVVVVAIIMFVVGYLKGNAIIDVFMLAVSLAVAAIPEGLSAVITITLAIGVQKMAKEKAIVRKLSSVEALGATEIICSDKTGTLTQNKMALRQIYFDSVLIDVTNIKTSKDLKSKNIFNESDLEMLVNSSVLCNDTKTGEEKGRKIKLGDPTEIALVEFGEKLGINKEKLDNIYNRVDEIPFDSNRKMMSTINKVNSKYLFFTKGAVESVLNRCDRILINGKTQNLDTIFKNRILDNNVSMARSALRVLACAYKEIDISSSQDKQENNLVFIGLVGMIDPPRKEAKSAVEKCFNAGMIPVMITGDNKDTAVAIAKELGILKRDSEAITGQELDKMSDEELIEKVNYIKVYARVSPENKIRIVKAWKRNGKTVAMTGDGVNDAPALKGADIGIGMGITGTEVSKSVASMILADDNFATIVVAIKEGRRIYNNIQNVIVYLLASNLAEVLLIFFATLFNRTILLPIQLLWINLVTDTIPAIALGFEKEEKDIMKQRPRNANEKFFTPFLTLRILIPAVIKTCVMFAIYFFVEISYGDQMAGAAVFISLSIIEILFSFVCRSDRKTATQIGIFSNIPMILCLVGTLILQYIVVTNPTFAEWLKIPNMPSHIYVMIIIASVDCIIIFEFIKVILAKKFLKNDKIRNRSRFN